ncbi:venom allergen 3-like isoform X1 [Leptopilina boulardi]|uniref:venom allergen 3-like isoform X1 n=1 Tax=Leptopilina boulardi TaxID=63433 RepID=UPI0021F66658|nr:venom allergen 3-like isoform X1 [Leptopilina boulardi]
MALLRSLFSLFTILTIVVLIQGQNDYCNICPDHTMCRFTNPRPVCNARVSSLTPAQESEIVRIHNEYRQRVASGQERRGRPGPQPRARNMPNMVWDRELATVAQRWANQCKFEHDTCRRVRRFNVGQNIATAWTTGSNPSSIRDLITMWYDEVALFNRNEVERYVFRLETGHYTQMVWATSINIGCGYVNHMVGNRNTVLLVCNYGPGGNIRGGKIYEIAN